MVGFGSTPTDAHGDDRRITQGKYGRKARAEGAAGRDCDPHRTAEHQEGEESFRTTLESLISMASRGIGAAPWIDTARDGCLSSLGCGRWHVEYNAAWRHHRIRRHSHS